MPIEQETIRGVSVWLWTRDEKQLAHQVLIAYQTWIIEFLQRPIGNALRHQPTPISDALKSIVNLAATIQAERVVKAEHMLILKSAFLMARQNESESVESRTRQTPDRDTIVALGKRLSQIDLILEHEALAAQSTHILPRLADYLTIQSAEEALSNFDNHQLLARKFDDKFRILLAPDLFFPDLKHFRFVCSLRDVPLCIVYIDVDDFKDFNTKHGEPHVDQHLLPKLMGAIEAHMFYHGSAYRRGGDEYVVLMPNRSIRQATSHLQRLQSKIANLDYFRIKKNPTISIGVIEIDSTIYKSNIELEALAAAAKDFAKKKDGKNSIAYFESGSTDEADLQIMGSDRGD